MKRIYFIIPVIYGLVSSILFGMIDAILFLTSETELDKKLAELGFSQKIVALLIGGISASVSIFIAHYIERIFFHSTVDIFKHPALDVVGILLGTLLIVLAYHTYYALFKK